MQYSNWKLIMGFVLTGVIIQSVDCTENTENPEKRTLKSTTKQGTQQPVGTKDLQSKENILMLEIRERFEPFKQVREDLKKLITNLLERFGLDQEGYVELLKIAQAIGANDLVEKIKPLTQGGHYINRMSTQNQDIGEVLGKTMKNPYEQALLMKKMFGEPREFRNLEEFINYMEKAKEWNAEVGPVSLDLRDKREDLSNRGIDDRVVKILAGALKVKTPLKTLLLNYNNISSEGAKDLAEALKENTSTSLDVLNMANNNIDDAGAEALVGVLKDGKVTILNLKSNRMSEEYKESLRSLQKSGEPRVKFLQF